MESEREKRGTEQQDEVDMSKHVSCGDLISLRTKDHGDSQT